MASTLTPKDKAKLPDWARSTMNQIEALGFFEWEFDWEYPVPDLGTVKRIQVRDEGHVGQAQQVTLYSEAMKRGDKFPPGVSTQDGFVLDWNTRQRAALKLGWPTFPVFVIQKSYEDADPFTRAQFHMLGAAFNTGGPKPLTRDEISAAVRMAASTGDWDTNKISRDLNITRTTVQGIFAEFRAEKRAELLGVAFNGTVSASTRAMLGHRSEKLADEPFREIVRLVQDSGLTGGDASKLVKRVVSITAGDQERLSAIANERAALTQTISKYQASGKKKPPLSIKARTYAEFFVGYADKIGELTDTNPNTRGEFLTVIQKLQGVVDQLVLAQHEANETVGVS